MLSPSGGEGKTPVTTACPETPLTTAKKSPHELSSKVKVTTKIMIKKSAPTGAEIVARPAGRPAASKSRLQTRATSDTQSISA